MDDAAQTQIGAAVIAVIVALLAAIRRRLKRGKRIVPRMRLRTYLSISNRSEPPTELSDADVTELDELDDRDTLRPRRRKDHDKR